MYARARKTWFTPTRITTTETGSVANLKWDRSLGVNRFSESRSALFRGRRFRDEAIVLWLRWYLRYPLSYRDLEEMMIERGLTVDHSIIGRWVLRYAPDLNERIRSEMRRPNGSWRCDETYVRVAGLWTYLYRAIDSTGQTIDFLLSPKRDLVAKGLPRAAIAQAREYRPRVINVDGHPAYTAAVKQLNGSGELPRSRPSL